MMRRQYWDGDLSLGTSKPGVRVRCMRVPGISFWQDSAKREVFKVPQKGTIYTIRSNILTQSDFGGQCKIGVYLVEISNPEVIADGELKGEPFFPFECFATLGSRP